MHEKKSPAETIAGILELFLGTSRLRLCYHLTEHTALPTLRVDFSGPDAAALTAHNGDILHALEHLATQALRLSPDQHDQICFDASGYKAARDQALQASALAAIHRVRATGQPHAFPPMSSRERRLLHLALAPSGLPSLSSSDGTRRFVVLYPQAVA